MLQVARVLHLIYRLVVQPNTSKAATFVETFLGKGGVEMLLTLLRREAESEESDEEPTMDQEIVNGDSNNNTSIDNQWFKKTVDSGDLASPRSPQVSSRRHRGTDDIDGQLPLPTKTVVSVARSRSAAQKAPMVGTLGGISLSISADRVRNKFRNVDSPDGIMVGIVSLLGALVSGGHLKVMRFGSYSTPPHLFWFWDHVIRGRLIWSSSNSCSMASVCPGKGFSSCSKEAVDSKCVCCTFTCCNKVRGEEPASFLHY
jgi:hypothetical protein